MLDGMAIRKHLDWDTKRQEMVGFVDLGAGSLDEDSGEATEVLVVMAIGLQGQWKVPVGYFLINGISAELQKELVLSIVSALYDVNVKVVALVMDGHTTNQRMANLLGCSLEPSNIKCFFTHPSDSSCNVYVFFDACHLLKNVRGAVNALQVIHTEVGVVRWLDLVHLQQLQETEGLCAGNKLSARHINFHKQKMNVRLAAQTLSASVASALCYAAEMPCEGLDDCTGTADFISVIDHLFDVFNSRSPVAKGFKAPVRPENLAHTEAFFMPAKVVLLSMTDITGKKVCYGKHKVGVIGFLLNIESLLGLAKMLLLGQTPVQKYLLTYKLSKDHIELFFAAVRQRGGWNNNPSAMHFASAYKALLSHAGVSVAGSAKANCVPPDTTSMLNVKVTELDEIVPAITFETALNDHTYSNITGLECIS